MTVNQQFQEILKLNREDRILLVGKIWDSLKPEDYELSDEEKKRLDYRIHLLDSGQTKLYTWEEIEKGLKSDRYSRSRSL